MSNKQEINTGSRRLLGRKKNIPGFLWTQYFIEMQGFTMDESFMYQENLIEVLLEKNGRKLSSQRTKHIQVRYFFMKDCIAVGDITFQY